MKEINKILQTYLGLTKTETEVLLYIMNSDDMPTVKEMQKDLKKDRTTYQKVLTSLKKKGLIFKEQRNLDRGFCYLYYAIPKSELKNKLLKKIQVNTINNTQIIEEW